MTERFETHLGANYTPEWICSLSDEELAKEIRELPEWDDDLLRDLCWRADLIEEWANPGVDEGYDYMAIAYKAAEKLGVEI